MALAFPSWALARAIAWVLKLVWLVIWLLVSAFEQLALAFELLWASGLVLKLVWLVILLLVFAFEQLALAS